AAEEYLVDDGWQAVDVEPETATVDGDAIGIGPTVEPVQDNGHHNEEPEPQQTLFSWAEFMADGPVRPNRRRCKPQPASLSMFEWALGMEQEREAELVTAPR
ncbi:MAG: hypothetical protein OXO53_12695, partial [Chloroflexota bacterium]|nr:hypothetical protein [Chloroflexota bacterium]